MNRSRASLLLVSALVACSSKTEDERLTIEAACASVTPVKRSWTERCMRTGPQLTEVDWQRIETRLREACIASGSAGGYASTFPRELAACADKMRDVVCGASTACPLPPGSLLPGAGCVANEQCQSKVCAHLSSSTFTPKNGCGICVATVAIGASCNPGAVPPEPMCADEAICDSTSRTCVATTRSPAGSACGGFTSCESGLYCDSKVCRPQLAPGSACTSINACADGVCDVATSKCVAYGGVEGGSCGASDTCGVGLGCDPVSKTCVALTMIEPGQSCAGSATRCKHGVCSAATRLCPKLIANGSACAQDGSLGVCDEFAECIAGTCLYPGQVACD